MTAKQVQDIVDLAASNSKNPLSSENINRISSFIPSITKIKVIQAINTPNKVRISRKRRRAPRTFVYNNEAEIKELTQKERFSKASGFFAQEPNKILWPHILKFLNISEEFKKAKNKLIKNLETEILDKLKDMEYLKNIIGDYKVYFDDFANARKSFWMPELQANITFPRIAMVNDWSDFGVFHKDDIQRFIIKVFDTPAIEYQNAILEKEQKRQRRLTDREFLKELIPNFFDYINDPLSTPNRIEHKGVEYSLLEIARSNNLEEPNHKDTTLSLVIFMTGAPGEEYAKKSEEEQIAKKKSIESNLKDTTFLRFLIGDFKPYFDNFSKAPESFWSEELQMLVSLAKIAKINSWARGKKAETQKIIIEIFGQESQDYANSLKES